MKTCKAGLGDTGSAVPASLLVEHDATIAALKAEVERLRESVDAAVEGRAEVFFAVEDRERLEAERDEQTARAERAEAVLARHQRALAAGPAALRTNCRPAPSWAAMSCSW